MKDPTVIGIGHAATRDSYPFDGMLALDAWVTLGVEPLPSSVPRVRNGTLVLPEQVNFLNIPATLTRESEEISFHSGFSEPVILKSCSRRKDATRNRRQAGKDDQKLELKLIVEK